MLFFGEAWEQFSAIDADEVSHKLLVPFSVRPSPSEKRQELQNDRFESNGSNKWLKRGVFSRPGLSVELRRV
jgi:hypothetical protein